MLWRIVRKELLTSLLTLRLAVALIFTVILAVLTSVIGSLDYLDRMEAYRTYAEEADQSMKEARVYAQVRPHIVFLPQPLSIFCKGLDKMGGQTYGVSIDGKPGELGRIGVKENWFMKGLVEVDFAGVVVLLLSFLALVLGFDGICGEREEGTLKLVLTHPVSRGSIILGKLLGGMFSLWIPLAVGFVLALLIVRTTAGVNFTPEEWIRLSLFFFLSCLFLGQIFSLSLMVSAFTQRAATALIICLFGWLAGGIGYLNLLPSLTRYGVEEFTWQSLQEQWAEARQEFYREVDAWDERHLRPADSYMKRLVRSRLHRFGHPKGYAWLQQRNAFVLEKQIELADRMYQQTKANYAPLARESLLVDQWSILSPFGNYRILAKQLARTTLADKFVQFEACHRYRETFFQYLRGKNAFASRRWFTDDPEDQEPMIPHPETVSEEMLEPNSSFMQARMAWAEEQEKEAWADPGRRLNLSDLPPFGGAGYRSLGESLGAMAPGLAVMLLISGLSVLSTLVRFWHYDPS